jgi:prepilin-type N-terminal cleavage/methylation domain-containing protein
MKKSYLQKGFTLIELLVVIAIIGILSSVVLASLNSARGKGGDAAVKSNLSGIRAQAELMYNDMGCYTNTGTACTASACALIPDRLLFTAESPPFPLAEFSEAKTTDDNIPIIAITTSNSINVKPFCKYDFFITK